MSGAVDVLNPDKPKRIVVLASSPAVSEQTGWPMKSHAVRDGLLITGQQQYSGPAAARLIIEAPGV
jgi:putative intracellular protease/amidase